MEVYVPEEPEDGLSIYPLEGFPFLPKKGKKKYCTFPSLKNGREGILHLYKKSSSWFKYHQYSKVVAI